MLLLLAGLACMVAAVAGQNRRPTISFITQPEIVTDIGGDVEMKCTIQYASDYPVSSTSVDIRKHPSDERVNVQPYPVHACMGVSLTKTNDEKLQT